ncbi:immunity-related GTPase family, q2 [Scleropages formosus]|nr:interferon-inducible GTPase 5-like [Scleropages formosus]
MADVIKSLKVLEVLKESMDKNKLSEVKDAVEDLLLSRVNIAVIGERGAEKAAFINSLRGLGPEDEEAVKTSSPTPPDQLAMYVSPKHSDFRVWDLPAVPTDASFDPEEYMGRVRLLRFNSVIMTFSQSLHPNDTIIWREARALQKETVYFALLASEKESVEVLAARRQSSLDVLKAQGVGSQKVYMVHVSALEKLDFPALLEQMELDLQEIKANALLIALPALSIPVVQRKKDAFKAVIWAAASLSGGVSAIPVPLVSSMVDSSLAVRILDKARQSLGLDDKSIERLARQRGKDSIHLKMLRSCNLSVEVTKGEVKKRLLAAEKEKPSNSWLMEMALPHTAKSASRSFVAMLLALTRAIDEMGADAEKVVAAVVGEEK